MLDRAAAYAEAGADAIWIGLRSADDYVKAAAIVKKPLMAVVGNANFPATAEAMRAAKVSVGQSATMMNIALGAVDRALDELKTTGRMTEAQKTALTRQRSDQVEQVEELKARSRKYNLPAGSASER
jgi:2-methylisocitrate lyase-like PEP mutase family enzyme